jgi:hypothetical protein
VIPRLTHAFATALKEATRMHADGLDPREVAEVLAVAREIVHATLDEIYENGSHNGIEYPPIILKMRVNLEATSARVAVPKIMVPCEA